VGSQANAGCKGVKPSQLTAMFQSVSRLQSVQNTAVACAKAFFNYFMILVYCQTMAKSR
jgi:hypothetical protein